MEFSSVGCLLTCWLNRTVDNYKAFTRTQIQQKFTKTKTEHKHVKTKTKH